MTFSNTTAYSYIKWEAGPTSYGDLNEIEFYNGTTKLTGTGFGSSGLLGVGYQWQNVFDGNIGAPNSYVGIWHGSVSGSTNFVGMNLSGCGSTPTNCNYTVAPTANPIYVSTSGSSSLNANGSGPDISGVSFTWSGNGSFSNANAATTNAPAAPKISRR